MNKITGPLFGLARSIVAAPSAIAYGMRQALRETNDPFYRYEDAERESIKNYGHVVAGAAVITVGAVSELSSALDGYYMVPPAVQNTLLITNGASLVYEIGRSVVRSIASR